jgi:hypothetical protein
MLPDPPCAAAVADFIATHGYLKALQHIYDTSSLYCTNNTMDDVVDIGHLEAAKCLNARKDKLAIISAPYSCVTFSNNDTDSFDDLPNSTLTIQLVDLWYSFGCLIPQEKK